MAVEVELDFTKSVTDNANAYYQKSKKARKKKKGLKEAIQKTKKQLKQEKASKPEPQKRKKKRKRDWFEKFHWFFTSQGFLVIAGRDVKTNTEIVRKHMQGGDKYLHADVHGAPSTLVVSEGREVPEKSLEEAAVFAGVYSKAFSAGVGSVDVYAVDPDQVQTSAKSGEYLPPGSFVITGERQWFKNVLLRVEVSFDQEQNRVVYAPPSVIGFPRIQVIPGVTPKGELARKVKKELEKLFEQEVDVNEVLQALPSGKGKINEVKKS
jgi:predicted ribosome quality control (RQC) complex YloA/Tae2 family protein